MKALTVQQPWAWAIVHGGKTIENRTQRWSYRGPLAIHAGQRIAPAAAFETVAGLAPGADTGLATLTTGAIIGVADLVDVHTATPEHIGDDGLRVDFCCDSPWAEVSYVEHGGRTRRDVVHLVLDNVRPLDEPVFCSGQRGLWTPPSEVVEQIGGVFA